MPNAVDRASPKTACPATQLVVYYDINKEFQMEFYALALTLLIMFGACLSIDRHIKVEK